MIDWLGWLATHPFRDDRRPILTGFVNGLIQSGLVIGVVMAIVGLLR